MTSEDFARELEAERIAFDKFMARLTAASREVTDAANQLTDLVDEYMAVDGKAESWVAAIWNGAEYKVRTEVSDPANPYDMTADEIATTNLPTEKEENE